MTDLCRLAQFLRGCHASLLCALVILSCFAATEGRAEIALSLAPTAQDEDSAPAPLAYFSEQAVVLPVLLSQAESCPFIAASLVQLSARLEAEITQRRLLDCAQTAEPFDGRDLELAFEFPVPKVTRETRFEWRIAGCDDSGANCAVLIDIPFEAYPTDLLAPLKAWAARESLLVKDAPGELVAFLEDQDIAFVERPSGIAKDTQVISLLVEEDKALKLDALTPYLARGDVVVFREKAKTLPMIKNRQVAGRTLVAVELPLLGKLPSNPWAQKALLEVFLLLFDRADNT